jgi:SPP1 gp7 family putative phage head morphogenesis protein
MISDTCFRCSSLIGDILNKSFNVDVIKRLDPLDPDDYLVIVNRLSNALTGISRESEAEVLRNAVKILDVDWKTLSARQRKAVVGAISESIREVPKKINPSITRELDVRGRRVVRGTRRSVKQEIQANVDARIGVSLTLRDQRIIDHIANNQAFFVTDEYGRRADTFSKNARNIVARGLDQGLSQREIGKMLNDSMGSTLGPRRSRNYWNMLASVYVSRSRSYGQLVSYTEAGIEKYRFEAILDERTTDTCRMLHGKVYDVAPAMRSHLGVLESTDPGSVVDRMPFIREGRDRNGNKIMYVRYSNGTRVTVGTVKETGVGTTTRGTYTGVIGNRAMQEMSIDNPPLHPHCRSTIVAII